MSAVVTMLSERRRAPSSGLGPLLGSFAQNRRGPFDPYWLKESSEILSILASNQIPVDQQALLPFKAVYAQLPERLEFFPQYFRFHLSLALSLESLGIQGNHSASMAQRVVKLGLHNSLTGDIFRAEARYLLHRCGMDISGFWHGLDERLIGFASQSALFAIPNTQAAYELTHIVFYLSNYGKTEIPFFDDGLRALHNLGTLSFMEQNCDLLAEVCLALHYCDQAVPTQWLAFVRRHEAKLTLPIGVTMGDDYHCHLVTQWLFAALDEPSFTQAYPTAAFGFSYGHNPINLQRDLSRILFDMSSTRSADWAQMRQICIAKLSPKAVNLLIEAEQADANFEAFFANFSRAGRAECQT